MNHLMSVIKKLICLRGIFGLREAFLLTGILRGSYCTLFIGGYILHRYQNCVSGDVGPSAWNPSIWDWQTKLNAASHGAIGIGNWQRQCSANDVGADDDDDDGAAAPVPT